jgi:MFS family permease
MLGWVFGVPVYAASTVWASFMAGLAIGSLAAGTIGDRVRHPLRWMGVIEILIGATAVSTLARDREPDLTSLKGDVKRYVVPD